MAFNQQLNSSFPVEFSKQKQRCSASVKHISVRSRFIADMKVAGVFPPEQDRPRYPQYHLFGVWNRQKVTDIFAPNNLRTRLEEDQG